jgi:hypothetical protein
VAVEKKIMKATYLAACLLGLLAPLLTTADEPKHNAMPKGGVIPDEATAIKVAVAVWEPIYGAEQIAKEKPYRAMLANGVWTVQGSLPKGRVGGVVLAEISGADGRILRISHGK